MALLLNSNFSYTTQSQCDVLGCVHPTNRQAGKRYTHCAQWHRVVATQKYHIFRWQCRCTGPIDAKRPCREPADFYFVLWRRLARLSSTQTPRWTQWGCGHTWEWWCRPPRPLMQCCWHTPESLESTINEHIRGYGVNGIAPIIKCYKDYLYCSLQEFLILRTKQEVKLVFRNRHKGRLQVQKMFFFSFLNVMVQWFTVQLHILTSNNYRELHSLFGHMVVLFETTGNRRKGIRSVDMDFAPATVIMYSHTS